MTSLYKKLQNRVDYETGRIIWAYDPIIGEKDPFNKFKNTFRVVKDSIAGIKFNRQFILPYGLNNPKLRQIIDLIKENDIPLIMDAKVNDIGYTNESISRLYFSAGFDALIVNPFVGADGIIPIITSAKEFNSDVVFLVYMSHPSASFGYGREIILNKDDFKIVPSNESIKYFYELFAHSVNYYNVSGAIVGGTDPEKIQNVHSILKKDKLIFSPGIGAQGGDPSIARKYGMDFAIIGRSITNNSDPLSFCKKINELIAN